MGWEAVPFMIGGGAIHSEAVMRLVLYNAMKGNEGILGPSDLKVTALSTPGAAVNVGIGACGILGREPGQFAEMYGGRMPSQDTAPISPAGSGAGRSDLVIARVEDPNVGPWTAPSNIAQGPYVYTRVVSGVPSTTTSVLDLNLGQNAIALARVDLPANTAVITQSMITDLRKVANPRRDRQVLTVNVGGVATVTTPGYTNWLGSWTANIPLWATRAVILCAVSGARLDRVSASSSGTANGAIRVALEDRGVGATPGTANVVTQGVAFDLETTAGNVIGRYSLGCGDTVTIPAALRGLSQIVSIQAERAAGTKNLYADTATFGSVDIEFQEVAV